MTVQPTSSPIFAVANLTSAEQEQLRLVADEEQRSVLYREMRRGRGIRAEDDFSDLSVAENLLTFPSLQPVFDKLKDETDLIRETDMLYFPSYGTNNLRESVAARLTESFQADPPIKPADVFGTAGVASALQAIALGLQLPIDEDTPVPRGSSVLLPAPFWQGFHWSFKQAPNLHRVPVDLGKDFELTVDALQHAYEVTNPKPKLLALTNPHNPLGVNYSKELLESIYTWALEKTDMHIISDEMYCHSQLHSNLARPFVSALALQANKVAPERVHVVWGFAKDFGLSGFRAGFVISKSPHVHNAMEGSSNWLERRAGLSWFSAFDSLKHRFILPLVSDDGTIWNQVMAAYQKNLRNSHDAIANILNNGNIPYYKPVDGAQFFWLDLREFLPSEHANGGENLLFAGPSSYAREQKLADNLLREAKVKLLTGGAMYCPTEGYFRLCYTALEQDRTKEAVTRMVNYLKNKN